ncbi:hypothetical protein GGR21_002523 [Dysgonomonas hofstadii]|uniref:PqqD family protein n=1 Tax=Dysgonomonas hofstadii TaxID=637886 RepID=A0A840CKN0_9BACT|nr:PqqD family protein [Dysgonomonas hofstadii]MBB4036617.1 hypothetical protein [Dysgonomonas hofstadii]
MRIKEGFKLRTVGNEYIVTGEGLGQVDFNKLIALNASAAYLWQQVEGQEFDESILAGLLAGKYDINAVIASQDAKDIIAEWLAAGIIE